MNFFHGAFRWQILFLLPFRSSAWFFKLYEKHLSHKQCASSNRISITSHQVFTRTCIFHFDRVYNETALEPVMHIPVKKSNTIKRWWRTIILKLCALFQFTNSVPIYYEQTRNYPRAFYNLPWQISAIKKLFRIVASLPINWKFRSWKRKELIIFLSWTCIF